MSLNIIDVYKMVLVYHRFTFGAITTYEHDFTSFVILYIRARVSTSVCLPTSGNECMLITFFLTHRSRAKNTHKPTKFFQYQQIFDKDA